MFEQQKSTFTKAASHGVKREAGTSDTKSEAAAGAIAEEEAEVKDIRLLLRLFKI
jgi:hypothetical protein